MENARQLIIAQRRPWKCDHADFAKSAKKNFAPLALRYERGGVSGITLETPLFLCYNKDVIFLGK